VRDEYRVFLGLDVGKQGHHAVGLNRDGKRLHDAALPNTEAGLRKLFDKPGSPTCTPARRRPTPATPT
jgi:hypothetical protein